MFTAASILSFLGLLTPMLSTLEGDGITALQAEIAKISNPVEKQVLTDLVNALQPFIIAQLAKVA